MNPYVWVRDFCPSCPLRIRAILRGILGLASIVFMVSCVDSTVPETLPMNAARLARSHFEAADGAVLPIERIPPRGLPPEAIVLAVHGFNDYRRAFALAAAEFQRENILLIAYDQRGFGVTAQTGRWAGVERYGEDLKAILIEIHRQYPDLPIFVLGESMGAAVAITALRGFKEVTLAGLILSAPALWSRDTMPWYQQWVLALASGMAPDLTLTGSGLRVQASDNLEALRALGRDVWVIKATRVDAIAGLADLMDEAQVTLSKLSSPILMLYGGRDEVIPWTPIANALKRLDENARVRLVYYPSGYHLLLRDLGRQLALADLIAFIRRPLGPVPSGCEISIKILSEQTLPQSSPGCRAGRAR